MNPPAVTPLPELGLLRGALDRDMPLLGICRGFQLLNIAYGGTLVQHLDDVVDGDLHRVQLGEWSNHPVEVLGGKLRELVPSGTVIHSDRKSTRLNSSH